MTEPKRMVRSREHNRYGPFENGTEAAAWAKQQWPDQDQGDDGWDIERLHDPAELSG